MNGKKTNKVPSTALKEVGKDEKKGAFSKFKGKKFRGRKERGYDQGTKFNDLGYYTKNQAITDSFAKLPFNYILGNRLHQALSKAKSLLGIGAVTSFMVDYCVSNEDSGAIATEIITEDTPPTNLARNILNQVATIIYTTMRRNNAGATNDIEPSDVITSNLLASVDINANAVAMRRVFKIANSFSWKNRLLPRVIFNHLGIDYDDFIANQAAYRGRFNTLVALARTIKTLTGYPFINAFIAEFENIFKDAETDTGREQLWVPVKGVHHIYDYGTSAHPGGRVRMLRAGDLVNVYTTEIDRKRVMLTVGNYNNNGTQGEPALGRKFSVDLNILEVQINRLINDPDFNIIQADIEKAFGEQSGYMVIDSVPEVETYTPIYSGEFMTMVHNAKFLEMPDSTRFSSTAGLIGARAMAGYSYVNDVLQAQGVAENGTQLMNITRLSYSTSVANSLASRYSGDFDVLDSELNDPSSGDVVLMTRYINQFDETPTDTAHDIDNDYLALPTGNKEFTLTSGSNLLVFGLFTTMIATSSDTAYYYTVTWNNSRIPNDEEGMISIQAMLFQYSVRPRFFATSRLGDISTGVSCTFCLNDICNFRPISRAELNGIQESCFLSLWDLPSKSTI